jgi:hypothetical protein
MLEFEKNGNLWQCKKMRKIFHGSDIPGESNHWHSHCWEWSEYFGVKMFARSRRFECAKKIIGVYMLEFEKNGNLWQYKKIAQKLSAATYLRKASIATANNGMYGMFYTPKCSQKTDGSNEPKIS